MHRDIGNHNQILWRAGNPVAIGIYDQARLFMHRAVTGGDDPRLEAGDFAQVHFNRGPEGHHDFGIIPFGRLH